MYYDRRIPPELLNVLLPGAALGWLLPWLATPAAAAVGAHVQTRRNELERRTGAIQLYVGRTSPLEVRARRRGRVRLHADPRYEAMTPELFGHDLELSDLARASGALREHSERAAAETVQSFVAGEGAVHAGLMRHYGHFATSDGPFIALDSEAKMGFSCDAHRKAFGATVRALVALPSAQQLPSKLDLVAVDRLGHVLLVEVKADASGLLRAAWQAAVHVARFRALLVEHPAWVTNVLREIAVEKVRIGLLGSAGVPPLAPTSGLTPVIAAPDPSEGWAASWRREIAPVLSASGGALTGLRLWRLAADGRVVEDIAA